MVEFTGKLSTSLEMYKARTVLLQQGKDIGALIDDMTDVDRVIALV